MGLSWTFLPPGRLLFPQPIASWNLPCLEDWCLIVEKLQQVGQTCPMTNWAWLRSRPAWSCVSCVWHPTWCCNPTQLPCFGVVSAGALESLISPVNEVSMNLHLKHKTSKDSSTCNNNVDSILALNFPYFQTFVCNQPRNLQSFKNHNVSLWLSERKGEQKPEYHVL